MFFRGDGFLNVGIFLFFYCPAAALSFRVILLLQMLNEAIWVHDRVTLEYSRLNFKNVAVAENFGE